MIVHEKHGFTWKLLCVYLKTEIYMSIIYSVYVHIIPYVRERNKYLQSAVAFFIV